MAIDPQRGQRNITSTASPAASPSQAPRDWVSTKTIKVKAVARSSNIHPHHFTRWPPNSSQPGPNSASKINVPAITLG